MAQEAYLTATSPSRVLGVMTEPYGEVTILTCPSYVLVDDPVEMVVRIKNTGGDGRYFKVSVWDEYATPNPIEVASTIKKYIEVGASVDFFLTTDLASSDGAPPIMPNRKAKFRANALHEIPQPWPWPSQWDWDGWQEKEVVAYKVVETEITLTLDPSTVDPGANYRYTGRLKRTDTGAGLSGKAVNCYRAGKIVGKATTVADGNYELILPAPTVIGSYTCQAIFPGEYPWGYSSSIGTLSLGPLPCPACGTPIQIEGRPGDQVICQTCGAISEVVHRY